ncbi:nucleotidyltransferase [Fischerella thermalis CCMEE 5273]|nr:nucleotidyltransferase [Fischerella thermalis CCMEE 5273]
MDRLKQRLETANQAISRLEEILSIQNPSVIERDAAIQRFEFSFEAQWKLAKHYLRTFEGIDVGSPKSVIRSCREVGLLTEQESTRALELVDDQN